MSVCRMAGRAFYQFVFKRSSTFALAMVVGAFFFERAFDHACEYMFEELNRGRLWNDIKDNYKQNVKEINHDGAQITPKNMTQVEDNDKRKNE